MEPNFNSSFIPKHTQGEVPLPGLLHLYKLSEVGGYGLGFFVATLVFFLSVMGAVGVFAYIKITEQAIEVSKQEVLEFREQFQPEATNVLARFDTRLKEGRTLLKNHVAPTGLLTALEKATLADVQYLSMTYQGGANTPGGHSLVLEGEQNHIKRLHCRQISLRCRARFEYR
jgi:hypothetical protein